jgi:predicted rRNA methylase YqxC with S4 and FtsJ domains
MKKVNNENPNEHWEFINVNGKTVLDLGCGRWEHVEYRDPNWPTTPEYWTQKGANQVIGIDADQNEIDWFLKMYKNEFIW